MDTVEQLPAVLASLSQALEGLPSALSATTASLPSLLSDFATDLAPIIPSISAAQQEALLTNSSWLTANLDQLGALTRRIPLNDLDAATHEDLLAIIQLGVTKYDITTMWAPDLYAIFLAFFLAMGTKFCLMILLPPRTVKRVRNYAMEKGQAVVSYDVARLTLAKPARAAVGHALNLAVSTAALGLQVAAYRLFVLPSAPIRFSDIQHLSMAMKILLVGYAADLLFSSDLNPELWLHHLFTFGLLCAGQLCAFKTNSPKFFRLAQWLILQATTEQSTFAAMICYHLSTYLKTQNHRPGLQRSLLRASWRLLKFTEVITFPQKIVPAGMALYWLARMWHDIDSTTDGRFWLGWATSLISVLLLLQVKFCDDVFPICNYVHYKLHPSNYPHAPPRTGPVMRFLFSLIPGSARRRRLAHEKRQREGAAPSRPRLATQGTLFIAMLYAQSREVSFGDQSLRSKRSRSAFGSVAGGRGGLEGLGEEGELTDEVMEMEEAGRRPPQVEDISAPPPVATFPTPEPAYHHTSASSTLLTNSSPRPLSRASSIGSVYSVPVGGGEAPSIRVIESEGETSGEDGKQEGEAMVEGVASGAVSLKEKEVEVEEEGKKREDEESSALVVEEEGEGKVVEEQKEVEGVAK